MNWAKRVAVCVEHQTVFRNRKIEPITVKYKDIEKIE